MSQPPQQALQATAPHQQQHVPYNPAANGGRGQPIPFHQHQHPHPHPHPQQGGLPIPPPPPPLSQQQQQQQHYGGRGMPGRMAAPPQPPQMSAWQPTGGPPYMTAGAPLPPGTVVGIHQGPSPRGYPPHHQQTQPFYPPPQAAYAPPYAPTPGGSWQPTYQNQGGSVGVAPGAAIRGGPGIFYPPQHQQQQHQQQQQPTQQSQERKKKPLTITDKEGNVIDLSSMSSSSSKKSGTAASASASMSSSDAGAKMRQAAIDRINGKDEAMKKEAEEKARKEAEEEKARKEAEEEKVRKEAAAAAEEKARKEAEEAAAAAEEKARKEAEEAAAAREAKEKAKREAEEAAAAREAKEKAKREAEEAAAREAAEKKAAEEAAARQKAAEEEKTRQEEAAAKKARARLVFTKETLLKLRLSPECQERPEQLLDMTIVKGPSSGRAAGGRAGAGGGGGTGDRDRRNPNRQSQSGGSDDWKRGNEPPRRQSSKGEKSSSGGDMWARGSQLPPPPPSQKQGQGKGGGGGRSRGNQKPNPQYLDDGTPVVPLKKTENHWRPQKNATPLIAAEKLVKSILNKMTKEKFEVLSQQMMEIPIQSYEMLTMMIENVYDKAIDEPAFGEIYADLCVKLSQLNTAKGSSTSSFVHIIESDEEPPTESEEASDNPPQNGGGASHNTVYRWSNDVSTTDSEIVGPFASEGDCRQAAVTADDSTAPIQRGDMELELVSVSIRQSMFIKVMKKKHPSAEDGQNIFYTVYFPVSEATECGQQLSAIHLSRPEAVADANKKNSFKRSLLNKCEEEFNKQDIYKEWKEEKDAYEMNKASLTEVERAEKEEELRFRRIRIKKQMLGNVKFIGQLFKKNLLKEKIMRYCIGSLLKLEELKGVKSKNPEYKDTGNTADMDEEDHEAICSMFATIGSTIDKPSASSFMTVCFNKISDLSKNKLLPSRSRFMYKDLIELRQNAWVPRRKEEKAKTIEEIRKDFENEERKQAEQSARESARPGGSGGGYGRQDRGPPPSRGDFRQQSNRGNLGGSARNPRPKPSVETDEEGFTTIASAGGSKTNVRGSGGPARGVTAPPPVTSKTGAFAALASEEVKPEAGNSNPSPGADPLSEEQLERRIKSMRSDFITDGGNEEELKLSIKELEATPDAGQQLVQQSCDRMMDCKEAERAAIVKIISVAAKEELVSADDIKAGLVDGIEFIDSVIVDSPRAYEYLGELLASLLRIGTIDVEWVCEQLEKCKVDPSSRAPHEVTRETIRALKDKSLAASIFNAAGPTLGRLLGSDAAWNNMAKELL